MYHCRAEVLCLLSSIRGSLVAGAGAGQDLCDIVMIMFIGDFYFDTRGFQPSLCRAVELWTGNMLTPS